MNQHINSIAHRLSLRTPQRDSLEILARVCEIVDLDKKADAAEQLEIIKSEFPTVQSFERDFPSLCFALATGVGKTRLMGAFISYLHRVEQVQHFFVLAPNLTIYRKLIGDFTPNNPKYVFQGINEFAIKQPLIITQDDFEKGQGVRRDGVDHRGQRMLFDDDPIHINIFNISKINTEVRGEREPRFKRLNEYIGDSYFNYLSELDDLVLIMDESHRYRGSQGIKAINDLRPILGLELTATPQIEKGKTTEKFKNCIYSYPLSSALTDGYIKQPAVATRENFNAASYDEAGLEKLKLEDGIRVHEETKVQLEVYSRESNVRRVKPFMLVIARDTEHANALVQTIESPDFFEGAYQGKVITVHSKTSGEEKDEVVEQLLTGLGSDTVHQPALFDDKREVEVATKTLNIIKNEFERLPRSSTLSSSGIQQKIVQRVKEEIRGTQLHFEGVSDMLTDQSIAYVVQKTTDTYVEMTIDIPRIVIVPTGDVKSGYKDFDLDTSSVTQKPVDNEILIQTLRQNLQYRLRSVASVTEKRLEDYIVFGLLDCDDISYDDHSKLLYKLCGQLVAKLKTYLSDEEDVKNVLLTYSQQYVRLIQLQMEEHFVEEATEYEVHISKGFRVLTPSAFNAPEDEVPRPFRQPVDEKKNIRSMLFGGFQRCLYPVQKFDSDTERRFAVILENDKQVKKWVKPGKGNFQIHYSSDSQYEPDFVAETDAGYYLCEPKADTEMDDPIIQSKAKAASEWCKHATGVSSKPWQYLLVPHTSVDESKSLAGLASQYTVKNE